MYIALHNQLQASLSYQNITPKLLTHSITICMNKNYAEHTYDATFFIKAPFLIAKSLKYINKQLEVITTIISFESETRINSRPGVFTFVDRTNTLATDIAMEKRESHPHIIFTSL